jgi:hypothetical protein
MANNILAQSVEKMLAAVNAQILGRTCMQEVRRFPAMARRMRILKHRITS